MAPMFWQTLPQLAKSLGVIKDDWNGFNVLHTEAAQVGALDIGFVPGEGGKDCGRYAGKRRRCSLPARASTRLKFRKARSLFIIGTHGDRGAHRADVILPGAAYTEKSATYVNTEGRVQMADRAALPSGRRARRLGNPAGFVRKARSGCPLIRCRSCAPSALCRAASGGDRFRSKPAMLRY
jgi:NADH dehydrogenase/NADH:ubiquinone oxidoreductase subunit G